MTEFHRPTLLDTARHNRDAFDSGEAVLDEWLRRYAGQNRRRDTAATWVVTDASHAVVAYATVAMTAIDRSSAPPTLAHQAPDPIPALLIGRLAVDKQHSGLGVGTALVAHILATAVELNTKAACRAVVVNALHAAARGWWEHLGFDPFDPASDLAQDLYLLTADIQATLQRLP
ncbi:MAG TPA: GNAT family N-acetyltransferase [Solirubrobacteraceae bacterium]|nr:GNAT family N-acetyltransferase [Solirubrobacteraceae bacterium]